MDGAWYVDFDTPGGSRVRTTMAGVAGTEVIVGEAPAMRRPGNAPFIDVRRLGGNSTFVAVHEPYSDTPNVRSLRVVPLDEASVGAVVLEIQLADGVDTFASTLDPSGYEDGDGSVKAFRITPSERREEQTRLYVDGDPGMALMPDHVKQLFFPNWGIEGGLKLRVPQRVVRRNLYR